jgi:hypothetical protein
MKSLFDFNPKDHSIEIEWSGLVSNDQYGMLRFSNWYKTAIENESIIWNDMAFETIYELWISVTIFER